MNATPHITAVDATPQFGKVACPMCGHVNHHQATALPGWRHGKKPLWAKLTSPIRKERIVYGHSCRSCKHMFYVTRSHMPLLNRIWLLVLAGIAVAAAILLQSILAGS